MGYFLDKQPSSRPIRLLELYYFGSGTQATTPVGKGGDATGWKRVERGVDREDNSGWFRTFDPKADRYQYGPDYVGKFNQVTSKR